MECRSEVLRYAVTFYKLELQEDRIGIAQHANHNHIKRRTEEHYSELLDIKWGLGGGSRQFHYEEWLMSALTGLKFEVMFGK